MKIENFVRFYDYQTTSKPENNFVEAVLKWQEERNFRHLSLDRVMFWEWKVNYMNFIIYEMGGACSTYGGRERCAQGFGGETWVKETIGETKT